MLIFSPSMEIAMRCVSFLLLAAFLLTLGGCQKSPESVVDEQISVMHAMCDALESSDPKAKMAELQPRLEAISKKMKELNLTPEQQQKLLESRKDEMAKLRTRMMKSMTKNMQGFQEAMKGLQIPGGKP